MTAAILVSNGFNEQDMTAAQRALVQAKIPMRIVSPENGLVNGWSGTDWGHHFAVDAPLSAALGADYDMLIVPGGARSIEKLKLTAHTKRFISSFMASGKPVAVFGDAVSVIAFAGCATGRTVAGPEEIADSMMQSGFVWTEEPLWIDENMMSGASADEAAAQEFAAAMIEFFTTYQLVKQAA